MKIKNVMVAAILLFSLSLLMQAAHLMLSQVAPGVADMPTWVNQAEHLTLTGGMVIVIVILWRAFQNKDTALIQETAVVAAALQASTASNSELRKIIQESVDSKRELKESIDLLRASVTSRLPLHQPE